MSYNGDIPRVTAELADVPLDPMQRRHEIEETVVASTTVFRDRWQKACTTSGKVYLRTIRGCGAAPRVARKRSKV